MSRVFWDTNLFVYLFEENGALTKAVAELRSKMIERGDQLLTSTLALGEVLVKPIERDNHDLYRQYEQVICTQATVVPFDLKAARIFATLRAQGSCTAPDAIHLACAASATVDLFVTNDTKLLGKRVEGIQFIVSIWRVPI